MALQSLLQQAFSRRSAANARGENETRMRLATDDDRAILAREQALKMGDDFTRAQHDRVARDRFLGEREDRRASGAQPFSLVGKDFFSGLGRAQDEAAWEGKSFELGGSQGGRSMDTFGPLRQRMKTLEERQAEINDSGERANIARRRDEGMRQQNRGMEIRNDMADVSLGNAVYDPHGDNAFSRDMKRAGTRGEFDREQNELGFKQKLSQFFDPAHQGMLDNLDRRQTEPALETARIKGHYDLLGRQATAQGRVEEARTDRPNPMEALLDNEAFVNGVIEALSAETLTPQQRAQLALFYQINGGRSGGRGVDGAGAEAGAGAGAGAQVISRVDIEAYAREQGISVEQAIREAEAEGYAVR